MSSTKSSAFLSLPGELRNQIYEYLLRPDSAICLATVRDKESPCRGKVKLIALRLWPKLLRVCKQIHIESVAMLYDRDFTFFASIEAPRLFYESLSPQRNALVRRIQLQNDMFEAVRLYTEDERMQPALDLWKFLLQNTSLRCIDVTLYNGYDTRIILSKLRLDDFNCNWDNRRRICPRHRRQLRTRLFVALLKRSANFLSTILWKLSQNITSASSLERVSLELPCYYPRTNDEEANTEERETFGRGGPRPMPLDQMGAWVLAMMRLNEDIRAWMTRLGVGNRPIPEILSKTGRGCAIDIDISSEGLTLHTRLL